jgi:hypothetical protein
MGPREFSFFQEEKAQDMNMAKEGLRQNPSGVDRSHLLHPAD